MMEIRKEAEDACGKIVQYLIASHDIIIGDDDINSIVQQAVNEAIAADRESHKKKVSDLAAINARQEKEIERLRDALYESSQSLRTISILAGKKDGDLIDFLQVRGYANSRYMVAEQALVKKGSE